MSAPRRWARRAVLALAGSGLTAAGLGGTLAGGALGAEVPAGATGTGESPSSPVTATTPQAPAPAQGGSEPSTTTSTSSTAPAPSGASTGPSNTSTAPSPASMGPSGAAPTPSGTSTAPSAPAPAAGAQGAPAVVVQRSQQITSGTRRGASVTGSGQGGAGSGVQGGSGSNGAGATAKSGPAAVPAGTPNGVAPAPLAAGGEAATLATLFAGSAVSAQALDFYRIPLFLLPVYQAAAFQYDVPWQVLAAINEVETDYGTDLSVSTAGAVGWMQFMPATWLRYGVDATDAGYADPYNPVDAIFAAARYLHAAGASHDLRAAILAYNHSEEYAESVLLRARLIASYPRSVIATLTGLVDGRAPTPGARLAPGTDAGPAAEPLVGAGAGSAPAATPSASTGSSAAGGPANATAGAVPTGTAPAPLAAGALATGSAQAGASGTASGADTGSGAAAAATPGSTPAPPPRVAAARAQAAANAPAKASQLTDLLGAPGAPVVAVEDGRIMHLGRTRALGRYLVLRDIYGDVFTYAGLGSIAPRYRPTVPRVRTPPATAAEEGPASAQGGSPQEGSAQPSSAQSGPAPLSSAQSGSAQPSSAQGGASGEPEHDPAPTLPASAGHQSPLTLKVKAHAAHAFAPVSAPVEPEGEAVPAGMGRVRLYAHPHNPLARAAAARAVRAANAYRGGWRPLRTGSIVSEGTVLGHLDTPVGASAGQLRFAVRPAGDSGTIDPQPLLANWRQLGAALHPKGSRVTGTLLGATAADALQMSKGELERAVLADPGIQLDACARRDVTAGTVDRRVLAVLEFLSRSGLQPTVAALRCPRGGDPTSGLSVASASTAASTPHSAALRTEAHRDGTAVDISAINGIPIAGHQGSGTVTDAVIRTLLTLRGQFAPHRIVSLMRYPEAPSTEALPAAWNHIHIDFLPPHPALAHAAAAGPSAAAPLALTGDLNEAQWSQLIARIAALPKPTVSAVPSSAAIRDPQAAPTNRGLGARGLTPGT
jgi:hypothetical protein